MEPELVRGHDAEVAAAAAHAPEEIFVLVLARLDEPAVGRDDVRRDQVVAGEAVLGRQPAVAAAEREAADAGRRHAPARRRQAEHLRVAVELARRARRRSRARCAPRESTFTPFMRERLIRTPSSQVPMPATLWPPQRTASGSFCSRARFTASITSAAAGPGDQRRPLVDHRVEDGARLVVGVVARAVLLSLERGVQLETGRGTGR